VPDESKERKTAREKREGKGARKIQVESHRYARNTQCLTVHRVKTVGVSRRDLFLID